MKIFANCAFFLTLAIMLGVMIYDDIVEWRATLKSQREDAGTADEKPDGQAENVNVDASADNKTPTKKTDV